MHVLFATHHEFLVPHSRLLLDSFRRWLGRELVPRTGDPARDAMTLFEAPAVVLSAGTEPDPVLNYANLTALRLWGLDWDALTRMPSRLTAEPVHRERRQEFLERVRQRGFVDDYSGIRISGRGERFEIRDAIVWNVVDADGVYHGQAATFSGWTPLGGEESGGESQRV